MRAENMDYAKATAGLKTKSDKIRELSRRGVATADIARFLGIRYQHARNVLIEAGLYRRVDQQTSHPDATAGVPDMWVEMDPNGRIVLPVDLAASAGLSPGRLQVRRSEHGLEIMSRKAALAEARALLAPYIQPGRSIVDEFIADRRREAEHE